VCSLTSGIEEASDATDWMVITRVAFVEEYVLMRAQSLILPPSCDGLNVLQRCIHKLQLLYVAFYLLLALHQSRFMQSLLADVLS